jgi:polysaccharide deacetylase 2 family uncharacterized protein YibQ
MRTSGSSKGSQNLRSPRFIYVVFCLLAVFSAVSLDYINWKKGEKSYLISLIAQPKEAKVQEIIPGASVIVLNRLYLQGVPDTAISRFKDRSGQEHLKVDLPFDQYDILEPQLSQELIKAKASVLKKEEQEDETKRYFLWEVEDSQKQKLTILFSCKKAPPELAEKVPVEELRYKVALIMDDMGYSLDAIYDVLSIQMPITLAILPYSPLGIETANLAHRNGLEVLLHLPLESINNEGENNGIQGLIHSEMSVQQIIDAVDRNLDQVPYISGVNNHMGSKITPNDFMMHTILQRLKERNLFFVDSRTTGKSVAYDMARRLDIPTAERHVFLDGELDEHYIKGKLIELFTLAQRNGEAIGICHPLPETLKVLKENFHLVEEYGIEPVFVSKVVR